MTGIYLEQFATFAANGGAAGPDWLLPARRAALDRFIARGFPTTRDEDWKYTSVAPIAESDFRTLGAASGDVRADELAPFLFGHPEQQHTAVFVNGRFAPSLSTLRALPEGVRVLDLASAWTETPDLLERHLTRIAVEGDNPFTALNAAFMTDGAVVQVPADTNVALPIHLLFVTDAHAAKGVAHPRNLVIAGRNARASVLESYVALGDATYFTNAVSELVLEDGATLHHYKIQRESRRAYHVGTSVAQQGRDSHLVSFSFATGAALSRTNIYTTLAGEGCGATLNGLYMADGEQHVDHQTRIEHVQPNTFSREMYKGVLDGSAHGVFNGKVYVHPEAQKTDGKQSNDTLLLSEKAHIDTKPQLEIFADDVKCTHGATVGRLDETALFYMKSRGINSERARQLLTYAFAADVLEQLEVEPVRDSLEALTLARFTSPGE